MICPRCGSGADQEYHGPCERCRGEMRSQAVAAAEARRVAATGAGTEEAERALQGQERAIGS